MERGRGDEMTRESISGKVFILGICELRMSDMRSLVSDSQFVKTINALSCVARGLNMLLVDPVIISTN